MDLIKMFLTNTRHNSGVVLAARVLMLQKCEGREGRGYCECIVGNSKSALKQRWGGDGN